MKSNDFENVRIEDGKIYGLTLSYAFNVKLSESENPQVSPKVNCDGMPVEILAKKAWEAMKVSARPSMKKLDVETLKETYHGKTVSWRVMCSQEAANAHISSISMSNKELDLEIAKLQALQESRKLENITE